MAPYRVVLTLDVWRYSDTEAMKAAAAIVERLPRWHSDPDIQASFVGCDLTVGSSSNATTTVSIDDCTCAEINTRHCRVHGGGAT